MATIFDKARQAGLELTRDNVGYELHAPQGMRFAPQLHVLCSNTAAQVLDDIRTHDLEPCDQACGDASHD